MTHYRNDTHIEFNGRQGTLASVARWEGLSTKEVLVIIASPGDTYFNETASSFYEVRQSDPDGDLYCHWMTNEDLSVTELKPGAAVLVTGQLDESQNGLRTVGEERVFTREEMSEDYGSGAGGLTRDDIARHIEMRTPESIENSSTNAVNPDSTSHIVTDSSGTKWKLVGKDEIGLQIWRALHEQEPDDEYKWREDDYRDTKAETITGMSFETIIKDAEDEEESLSPAAVKMVEAADMVAKYTADEILRLIKRSMELPKMMVKQLTEEDIERIRSENPIIMPVTHGGDPLPGSWTRIDTPAYRDMLTKERDKAWTEGAEVVIELLKLGGFHTAAYNVAQILINNPRWLK